jgi:hypothetical protein
MPAFAAGILFFWCGETACELTLLRRMFVTESLPIFGILRLRDDRQAN